MSTRDERIHAAVTEQSFLLTQRAMLDAVSTKLVMILKTARTAQTIEDSALKPEARLESYRLHIEEISRVLSMTREKVAEARPSIVFPEERVQAILDEAVDKLIAILLEDG